MFYAKLGSVLHDAGSDLCNQWSPVAYRLRDRWWLGTAWMNNDNSLYPSELLYIELLKHPILKANLDFIKCYFTAFLYVKLMYKEKSMSYSWYVCSRLVWLFLHSLKKTKILGTGNPCDMTPPTIYSFSHNHSLTFSVIVHLFPQN